MDFVAFPDLFIYNKKGHSDIEWKYITEVRETHDRSLQMSIDGIGLV